jgi:light-regulated signal transduction histidine kinase (bacteriophytochrome)
MRRPINILILSMIAAKRMRILIKGLLDFSRIGTNENVENVDCNLILDNLLADIKATVTEANATISYGTLPVIEGCQQR